MGAPRRSVAAGILAATLAVGLAGALLGGVAAAQDHGTAVGPVDGSAVIRTALDAFDDVHSYRYEHRSLRDFESGMEVVTTGTIINGDPFRSRREISVGGEVGWAELQLGDRSWTSAYGGAFKPDEHGPDPHPGPLDAWAATLADVATAGVTFAPPLADTLDGEPVLRYSGTTAAEDPTASPDPMGDEPMAAQVQLVVDATTGRLVEATVATQRVDGPPISDPPVEQAQLETVRIMAVNDPANDEALAGFTAYADLPSPTPLPAGDPALEPVVLGALDQLAAASGFHTVTNVVTLGSRQGEERTIVTGPQPAAEVWLVMDGRRQVGVRMVGDAMWDAFGWSSGWRPTQPTTATCFGGSCDLAGLSDPLGPVLRPIAASFTELPADTLDGVAVRHLRSDAGSVAFGDRIPGTTELWIDVATGLPVRVTFDGVGLTRDTRISQVADPTLTVAPPAP